MPKTVGYIVVNEKKWPLGLGFYEDEDGPSAGALFVGDYVTIFKTRKRAAGAIKRSFWYTFTWKIVRVIEQETKTA